MTVKPDTGRNVASHGVGEGLWGAFGGLITSSTALVVLLQRHGASTAMIGAITAIEIVMTMAPQVLGSMLFSSPIGRQRRLIGWRFAAILPLVAAIGVVALLAPRLPAAGRLLSLEGRLSSFAILYLAASLFGGVSILAFSLIEDPEGDRGEGHPGLTPADMARWFRLSLADRSFRRFLAGRMLTTAGFCILPFVAVHYTSSQGGSLPAAQVVTLGVLMSAGAAISNVAFGWIGDRRGHRVGVTVEAALQALAIAIVLHVPGPAGCAAAYLVVGLFGGASNVANLNMVLETCPHGHRLPHITIANLLLSARSVFPLLAVLIVARLGFAVVLRGSLALSAAAAAWCLFLVREGRQRTDGAA